MVEIFGMFEILFYGQCKEMIIFPYLFRQVKLEIKKKRIEKFLKYIIWKTFIIQLVVLTVNFAALTLMLAIHIVPVSQNATDRMVLPWL